MTTENVGNYPLPWVELPVRITDRLHTDVGSTVKQVLAFLQVPQRRRLHPHQPSTCHNTANLHCGRPS